MDLLCSVLRWLYLIVGVGVCTVAMLMALACVWSSWWLRGGPSRR